MVNQDPDAISDIWDHVRSLEVALEEAHRQLLHATGWVESSGHPDSIWSRGKRINDKEYHLPKRDALRLQAILDGQRLLLN